MSQVPVLSKSQSYNQLTLVAVLCNSTIPCLQYNTFAQNLRSFGAVLRPFYVQNGGYVGVNLKENYLICHSKPYTSTFSQLRYVFVAFRSCRLPLHNNLLYWLQTDAHSRGSRTNYSWAGLVLCWELTLGPGALGKGARRALQHVLPADNGPRIRALLLRVFYRRTHAPSHPGYEEGQFETHVAQQIKHGFHETCHSVTFYIMKRDSKRCCDTTTPESIHTKDESKRGSAFAFIFGVNWPVQWM